tara:strand:- start:1759 stop:2976 length:1218 start_codon:yes stop_codon:yes gene_type:complete
MEIFGEKIEVLIPFQRANVINEISSKIRTTFCSVYKYFCDIDNYNKCVTCENCDRYLYHRDYLTKQHFCSKKAIKWMEKNTLDGKKYNIHFNMQEFNITLKLNVYGELEDDHMKLLISKCITMILINKILICEMEINLLLLPIKRVYPKNFQTNNNITLGVNEANGGFTTWKGNDWGKIYVWRKEELDKVLIHEMIHALHLDFHNYDLEIDQFFYDNFFIEKDGSFLFFEAYVEMWGELLNIIFNYSYELCLRGDEYDDYSLLYDKLCSELNFSMIQVSKLLLWYGFDTFTNCGFYCKDRCKQIDERMTEGTSLFSYYIVRSIYFYSLSQFLQICVNSKHDGKSAMHDMSDRKRHIRYLDLIKNNIDSYGKEIDKIMEIIKNNKMTISETILNSMRMSCQTHQHE